MKVKGTGQIEKRGNAWRIVICLGTDPVTGKRKRKFKTVHGTKAEATRTMNRMIRDLENGLKSEAETITFGEYSSNWHNERKVMGALKPSSLEFEQWALDKLNAYIEHIRLCDLDPASIRALYKQMAEDGVSKSAIGKLHMKLKQVLGCSVNDGLVLKNPCNCVEKPQKSQLSKRESLTQNEAARLLRILCDASGTDSRIIAVRIALATGMRRGEVLGLTWKHVDLEGYSIKVSQQYTPTGIAATKTENGNRRISIDFETAEALKVWKEEQSKSLRSLHIEQKPETPVISSKLGGFIDPRNFSRWFSSFCILNDFAHYEDDEGNVVECAKDAEGWPVDERGRRYSRSNRKPAVKKHYVGLKFHELRHTQATLLIANGVDFKTVSTRLGHSDVSLTLNLYAHAMPEKDRAAANTISNILHTS